MAHGQQNKAAYDHVDAYLSSKSNWTPQTGVASPQRDRAYIPSRKSDFILAHRLDSRSDTTIRCRPITYLVTVEADRIVVGFKECSRKIRGGQSDSAASGESAPSGDATPSEDAAISADSASSASGPQSTPISGTPEKSEIILLGIDLDNSISIEGRGIEGKEIVGPDGTPIPVTVIPQDIAQQ